MNTNTQAAAKLPALISALEHAAMSYAQDTSPHTQRRLNDARAAVAAALATQPPKLPALTITPKQLADHLTAGGSAELLPALSDERAAFEAWLKPRPYADFAGYSWMAWQARAALDTRPRAAALTPDEVRNLSAMQAGAPWTDELLPALAGCIKLYEECIAAGIRPFDPADLTPEQHRAFWEHGELPWHGPAASALATPPREAAEAVPAGVLHVDAAGRQRFEFGPRRPAGSYAVYIAASPSAPSEAGGER